MRLNFVERIPPRVLITTLVFFSLVILSLRLELQQREINRTTHHIQQDLYTRLLISYHNCTVRNQTTEQMNTLFATLADIERHSSFNDKRVKSERIKAYAAAKFETVNCVKPSPPVKP